MDESRVRYLITKFRAGEITESEKIELEAYWHFSVQEHQTIDFLNRDEKSALQRSLFDNINAQIQSSPRGNGMRPILYKVAASLAAVLLVGFLLYQYYYTATIAYTTAYAQTKKVVLPDSSVVTLNANTILRIPKNWDRSLVDREVWLEGEAFFEVKKLQGKTFTVYAGDVVIEVLGTSFNVEDRRCKTQIVLNTGKVKLKLVKAKQVYHMQPGDLVQYRERKEVIEQRLVDPEIYSAWKDHKLIFQDTRLKDIAKLLEDNYGYQVHIQDPTLFNRRFTGSVASDNVDMLLDKLSRLFDIKIQKENNLITMD